MPRDRRATSVAGASVPYAAALLAALVPSVLPAVGDAGSHGASSDGACTVSRSQEPTARNATWGVGMEVEPAAGLKVAQAHRLTAPLGRMYSVAQCIGPTSTRALDSRRNHPNPDVAEDFLLAGQESEFGGGHRQRVCRIRNACLRAYDHAVYLHLDPDNEIRSHFLKVEDEEALGPRFVRLSTQSDGLLPADKFVEVRGRIPEQNTVWHQGVHSYFDSFGGAGSLGHLLFDDMFSSYMAFRMFGFHIRGTALTLVLDETCQSASCRRFFGEWAPGLTDKVISRPQLAYDKLHCFDDLLIGVGNFASTGGLIFWINHGKAALFREFHAHWLLRMQILPRDGGGGGGHGASVRHRVLMMNKTNSWHAMGRIVRNFEEIRVAVEEELGLSAEVTAADYVRWPAREQIRLLHDFSVILSPQGGISFGLFFARPGTSVIFISHVMWEDLFWNNVEHINDLYYMPEDWEVVNHSALAPHLQWGADMVVQPHNILPLITLGAKLQERWTDMHT